MYIFNEPNKTVDRSQTQLIRIQYQTNDKKKHINNYIIYYCNESFLLIEKRTKKTLDQLLFLIRRLPSIAVHNI